MIHDDAGFSKDDNEVGKASVSLKRRDFLRLVGGVAAAGAVGLPNLACDAQRTGTSTAAAGAGAAPAEAAAATSAPAAPVLTPLPEKVPMILLTSRPVNAETPLKYFREDLTPNEAFYVRWHLGILPIRVDVAEFRLSVGGHVQTPMKFSLEQLKNEFEPVSVVAVNQCSGNSRSLYEPRMPGVQWSNKAVGNAKWTGVRVKDLLAKAGVNRGAVEVAFGGMDGPTLPKAENFAGTPDYVKSLPFGRAVDGEVIVAYAMNDKPLPMLNGFPLRLVVPGWYATYWIKALDEITVLDKEFDGFWMAKAYRVPNTPDLQESPKDLAKDTVPITAMSCRSLFVAPEPGEAVKAGAEYEVQGLAIDSGKGITKVEISADGGKTWTDTKLDPEIGKYSWRRWRHAWKPTAPGTHKLMVKATNAAGQTQTTHQWNRSGYARNVIESLEVTVS